MEKTKKAVKVLLFIFLILFPFGQLLRISMFSGSVLVVLNLIDIIVGFFLLIFLIKIKEFKKGKFNFYILLLLISWSFSLIYSFTQFEFSKAVLGGLYLIRLFSYLAFYKVISKYVGFHFKKDLLIKSLIIVTIAIALFGWFQYFFYPDLTALYYIGWDDHLFRLVGTFLDPGFTSILLVLGFLLILDSYFRVKNINLFVYCILILVTILFTYSRSGYLSLLISLLVFLSLLKKKKLLGLFLALSVVSIILLPRPGGAGVKLERMFSIYSRIGNYKETVFLWSKSPIFGFGYNNICLARQKYVQESDPSSHACSGSDSSILLILATTGVVGFLISLNLCIKIYFEIKKNRYFPLLISSITAILVHSIFVNSLFYSWIMGWFAILFSATLSNTNSEE